MWAEHFEDPALMANRDAETTRRKLERVVARLPLNRSSHVLDVGPLSDCAVRHLWHSFGTDLAGSEPARLIRANAHGR